MYKSLESFKNRDSLRRKLAGNVLCVMFALLFTVSSLVLPSRVSALDEKSPAETEGEQLLKAHKLDQALAAYKRALSAYKQQKNSEGMMRVTESIVIKCLDIPSAVEREEYCTLGEGYFDVAQKKTISAAERSRLFHRHYEYLEKRARARFELGKYSEALADTLSPAESSRASDSAGFCDYRLGLAYEAAKDQTLASKWFEQSKKERIQRLESDAGGSMKLLDPSADLDIYCLASYHPSPAFLEKVKNTIATVPSAERKRLKTGGIFVALFPRSDTLKSSSTKGAPRGYKQGSSFLQLPAYYSSAVGAVIVHEYYDQSSVFKTAANIDEVLTHELGHAVDHRLSEFSWTKPFLIAYLQDASVPRLPDTQRHLDYFLQTGPAGPLETFAQAFALCIRNGEKSPTRKHDQVFVAYFPNVLRLIREKIQTGF